MLGPAAEVFTRGRDFLSLRVDRGYALAAAVRCVYALRLFVEEDGVRIGSHHYPIQHGQSPQIEND